MKCAKDLETTKSMVIAETERKVICKAMEEHQKACEEAIKFCEEVIAPVLEEQANNGKELIYLKSVYFETDLFNNKHFCLYNYVSYRYKNKVKSEKIPSSKKIDFNTLQQYLQKYCFSCSQTSYGIKVVPNIKCED